jgi:hypothetical protein
MTVGRMLVQNAHLFTFYFTILQCTCSSTEIISFSFSGSGTEYKKEKANRKGKIEKRTKFAVFRTTRPTGIEARKVCYPGGESDFQP